MLRLFGLRDLIKRDPTIPLDARDGSQPSFDRQKWEEALALVDALGKKREHSECWFIAVKF